VSERFFAPDAERGRSETVSSVDFAPFADEDFAVLERDAAMGRRLSSHVAPPRPVGSIRDMSLAAEFHEAVEDQSPDWSDMLFELRLREELRFDEARLLMAPAQLQRKAGERDLFTFRISHTRGYGAYAPLAESCLAKLDAVGIAGELELVRVLHEVEPNWTQGPVLPVT
jgi:hypothetical protein